jgi:hypothetical protein
MRSAFNNIIDLSVTELKERFTETNCEIYNCLQNLLPSSDKYLDSEAIAPLINYLDLNKTETIGEAAVARTLLIQKVSTDAGIIEQTEFLYDYSDAFPNVYKIFTCALCFGASTATVENTFSTVTRLLTPFRRSMSHQRKSDLVLLSFERELTKNIDFDKFISLFSNKSRRLALS